MKKKDIQIDFINGVNVVCRCANKNETPDLLKYITSIIPPENKSIPPPSSSPSLQPDKNQKRKDSKNKLSGSKSLEFSNNSNQEVFFF